MGINGNLGGPTDADLNRAVRGFAQRLRGAPLRTSNRIHLLTAPFSGGYDATDSLLPITAGDRMDIPVAWDLEIIEWEVFAEGGGELGGSIYFMIYRATYETFPTFELLQEFGFRPQAFGGKGKGQPVKPDWTYTLLRDGDIVRVEVGGGGEGGTGPTATRATLALRCREI